MTVKNNSKFKNCTWINLKVNTKDKDEKLYFFGIKIEEFKKKIENKFSKFYS